MAPASSAPYLFILMVIVYYKQNYIPKPILQRPRKKISAEHSTAFDRTLTSRGQRGDAQHQSHTVMGKWFSWSCTLEQLRN